MDEAPFEHIEFYEVIVHGTDLSAQANWNALLYCRNFNNYLNTIVFDT